MQPHILFPILIFAFGMGAFLTTFVGDISEEDKQFLESSCYDNVEGDNLLTKEEILKLSANKYLDENSDNDKNKWFHKFQESRKNTYHYPVTEVSIHLPLDKPDNRKIYSITTEYLEPYQNFCVNQVLKKNRSIRYKIIESGDRLRFKINSTDKKTINALIEELKFYDIKTTFK